MVDLKLGVFNAERERCTPPGDSRRPEAVEKTDARTPVVPALTAPAQTAGADSCDLPEITVDAAGGWQLLNLADLWRARELIWLLAWRDVKVRYKQTVLGAAWAVLQPGLTMAVFALFLGRLAHVPSDGFPYPLFVYAGLLPWSFFATAVTCAGNSIVDSERLITKVYFPRLAIPFAAVGAALVDLTIASGLLLVLMAVYGARPGWGLLLVPGLVALTALAALGAGSLVAALNVRYRDFRYVIPFLVQLWMFATPSVYMQTVGGAAGPETLPPGLAALLWLNPLTPLIAAFRAAALGGEVPWPGLAVSAGLTVVLFLAGCAVFRRVEDSFADVI
jgi:lipopolysaccharide transport system permease protein